MQFRQAGKYILNKLAKELPAHLSYHNVGHTQDVFSAAERIAEHENISQHDKDLLLTAAWYHDSGFLKIAKGHEEESCGIAQQVLPQYGYNQDDIEKICGMIRATKVPQLPKNHLEQILADADLDYLGRDDFFAIGDRLYQELRSLGALHNEREWNESQLQFLTAHRYFTKTAQLMRQEKKEENLEQIRAKLAQ